MSHIWLIHIKHMKEAYHPCGRVVMYVCMNHVTQTCERVMAHLLIFFIIAAAAPASMKLPFKNVFELCRFMSRYLIGIHEAAPYKWMRHRTYIDLLTHWLIHTCWWVVTHIYINFFYSYAQSSPAHSQKHHTYTPKSPTYTLKSPTYTQKGPVTFRKVHIYIQKSSIFK